MARTRLRFSALLAARPTLGLRHRVHLYLCSSVFQLLSDLFLTVTPLVFVDLSLAA